MYERAIREYKHHSLTHGPNTAVFMMVGSFYELYDYQNPATGETQTSMRRAVELLGIALKVKVGDGPGGLDGLFAGFPDFQLHKFAAMLTRENWTVVVIDQDKNAAGRVTRRRVTRILTPATHTEAITGPDAAHLAGLWLEAAAWSETGVSQPPTFAAAALDLTTGELHTYEGQTVGRRDLWSADDLLHFFQVYPPKELVVWWRGAGLERPEESALRRTLGVPAAALHIRGAAPQEQGALEKGIIREDLLRRCFNPKTMLPLREVLGLAGRPTTERALAALLLYLEDHNPSAMEHLHPPVSWSPREAMFLGNHALTQLNMITAREEDSVLGLFGRVLTPMGRRAIRRRLLFPTCDSEELERRYEEVAWCQGTTGAAGNSIPPVLKQIHDLSRLHRRISTGAVGPADVLALDQSYICAHRVAEAFAAAASPLQMPADILARFDTYLNEFERVFSVEKSRPLSPDLFCLQDAVAPRCAAIEQELVTTQTALTSTYESLINWLQADTTALRLEFKEVSIQLAGSKTFLSSVNVRLRAAETGRNLPAAFAGFRIHDKKSAGSMELPSLNTLYGKILQLRSQLAAAAREEVRPLCDAMSTEFMDFWDTLEGWVARADCSFTLARVASDRGFCRPELVPAAATAAITLSSLEAIGLRHPLIEAQQTRLEYVQHTVSLGADPDQQGWLVYGMNASGKSSLMKAVGIAVLLAQAGSFVPASSFRFTPFSALFTRILNTDNLWAGLSSFAVEMTELREILTRAGPTSLVLGDEVCSGTESISATALVAAALRRLTARGARFIFATHLHGLQSLPAVQELAGLRVWHLRVRYDAASDRLIYDRTLHPGAGSSLYGLEVAKAMAIPFEVLEDAQQIRRQLTGAATEADAPASDWSAAVHRRTCEVCSAAIVRDLEVHHIRPRAEAGATGHFADGSNMNAPRNLVVVCQACHDKHHAGEIQIGQVKQTSEGPKREVLAAYSYQPLLATPGLTAEQLERVHAYLRKYPSCPPSRAVFDLDTEGIKLSVKRLTTIRQSLPS